MFSSKTSPYLVHFQPLIGQADDAPAYVHQAAQKVKLGDSPTCFHLSLNYIGHWKIWLQGFLSFLFSFNRFGLQVSPLL